MERLTTSSEARDILDKLNRTSGIRKNYWARAAIGLSLSLDALPTDDDNYDSDGQEFSRAILFGDDFSPMLALLRERHGQNVPDDELARVVKRHLERGTRLLAAEYERVNRRGDELMLHLLSRCARLDGTGRTTRPARTAIATGDYEVTISLGTDVSNGRPVMFNLTQPGVAPHLAVMGRSGTGKTRTALGFIMQVTAAGSGVPCVVFDYAKGDIAGNTDFVNAIGAQVVRLPDTHIPMAPLAVPHADEHALLLASRRFRDTICAVVPGLGAKQKSRCLQIIRDAYHGSANGAPDIEDVVALAEQTYASNGWPDDSLLACMREFVDFQIFRRSVDGIDHELFDKPHVIDVHELPESLRKLSVFLVLDRLYSEIMSLDDAPIDSNSNRQLRLVVAIDEAHHYLSCRQPTLEQMVREVRSKGVGIWLLSQSPDDFDQPKYNFAREMGLSLVFSCVLEKPRMLEALLGGKVNPQRLSQLPAGVAMTRLPGTDRPVDVRAWQPPTT